MEFHIWTLFQVQKLRDRPYFKNDPPLKTLSLNLHKLYWVAEHTLFIAGSVNWLNVEVFIAHQFVASLLIRTGFNAKTQKMSNIECAILLATCKAERLAEVDAFLKSGNKPFLDEVKIYQETQRDGNKVDTITMWFRDTTALPWVALLERELI